MKTLDNFEEKALAAAGYKRVFGLDEVGVGPLAGPVVAGAVCLPVEYDLEGLYDSKKISEKTRARLDAQIKEQAIVWAVAEASVDEINSIGIRQATFLAYSRALERVGNFDFLLVDAWAIPRVSCAQKGIVRGDSKIASIAAASIIAKVFRDNLMSEFHLKYPAYGFDKHKGYGTPLHLDAIRKYGPCDLHRTSWSVFGELT
jgi:ribonuclease HII